MRGKEGRKKGQKERKTEIGKEKIYKNVRKVWLLSNRKLKGI